MKHDDEEMTVRAVRSCHFRDTHPTSCSPSRPILDPIQSVQRAAGDEHTLLVSGKRETRSMVEKIFSMSSTKFKLTWRIGPRNECTLLFLANTSMLRSLWSVGCRATDRAGGTAGSCDLYVVVSLMACCEKDLVRL
jgi:hypothetical protein